MNILWLAGAGFLVWYLIKHQAERPVWPWIGLGVLALPLLGHGRGFGMMGGGMMGGSMMGRGMMGGGQGMHGMMMGGGNYMGRGMDFTSPWTWVAMGTHALVIAGLVVLAVVLVRRALKARPDANSPLAILEMRLAKGEVSVEEYDQAKSRLQK